MRLMTSPLHSAGGLEPFVPEKEIHPCVNLSVVDKERILTF